MAKHSWGFRHRYEATGVTQVELNVGYRTIVLVRCECGKFKTRLVDGAWTLEELKGESDANVS